MKKLGILLLIFLLFGGIWFFFFSGSIETCTANETCSINLQNTEEKGDILPYSPENLKTALDNKQKVALYFKANWCVNCISLEQELEEKGIPAQTTLLLVEMEDHKELRKKYQVNNLHTLILLDQHQEEIGRDDSGLYQNIYTLLK